MQRRWFLAGLPGALLWARRATAGDTIVVFAAASLTDVLREIGAEFERRTGATVVFSFAGSNTLARQIRAGAPADVFVSAHEARMDELVTAGLVLPAERVALLSNRLAVVVPVASPLTVRAPSDLARVRRLALADPEAVPAGIYARQWLQTIGLWSSLRDRVIPTLDVRAALAAVASRVADAGIVYRTDAAISRRVRVTFEAPADETPQILYPAAVVGRVVRKEARAFLEYLRSAESKAVFEGMGFVVLQER